MRLVLDYMVSLTNLYGIVTKEKVIDIYNQQNKQQIDAEKLEIIIDDNHNELNEHFTNLYRGFFVHESILVHDDFDEDFSKSTGKPFYIPLKDDLLKYKDEFYFEKTREYRALLRYVQKHFTEGNKEKAKEICEDIQGMCHVEARPNTILNEFTRRDIVFEDEKQVSEVLNLIMTFANNMRLWSNNGHTPQEIFEAYEKPNSNSPSRVGSSSSLNTTNKEPTNLKVMTTGTTQKVGRNDPCPCGSGKKYKKCCL